MTGRTLLRGGAACAVVLLTAAGALAENLRVPRDFETLDDALRAAAPGDRIVVRRGVHLVSRPVRTEGLTLVGRGAKIRGPLEVTGNGVTVRGFRFLEGALTVRGDDVVVTKNRFQKSNIVTTGDGDVVTRNRVQHAGAMIAIETQGADTDVARNRLKNVICAVVSKGDGTTVRDNDIDDAEEAGVIAEADNVEVRDNEIDDVGRMDAITVIGDDARIDGNAIDDAPGGIRLEGDGGEICENDVNVGFTNVDKDVGLVTTGCPAITVITDEPGTVIADNEIVHTNGSGIVVDGDGATITGNEIAGRDPQTSIAVIGSGNQVTDNSVTHVDAGIPDRLDPWRGAPPDMRDPADGIAVEGRDNTVSDNRIKGAFDDGVDVRGRDNDVCRNTVTAAADEGIDLHGRGNLVEGNVVKEPHGVGIDVNGSQNDVCRNTVKRPGRHGVVLAGNHNLSEQNVVTDPGRDGVLVLGAENRLGGDEVEGAAGCGVFLADGGEVAGCSASDCAMGGLVNLDEDTTVTDSTFTHNTPVDVIDLGGFESFDGNRVGAVSSDPALVGEPPTHDIHDDPRQNRPAPMGGLDAPFSQGFPGRDDGVDWTRLDDGSQDFGNFQPLPFDIFLFLF